MQRYALSLVAVMALGLAVTTGCGGNEPAPTPKQAETPKKDKKERKADKADKADNRGPKEPLPTLIVSQAHFQMTGKPKPLPAKIVLLRNQGDTWFRDEFTDEEANVFHKAIAWRDGILTIGAETSPKPATLKHWKRVKGAWKGKTLWSQAWEGAKFNRLRDLEIGDVTGDGHDNIVIATHDQGVVAVGTEGEDGWTFVEMDQRADTFVHEIEIGDVDGDGVTEFYATPSARNKASGASQPGSVWRYDFKDGAFVGSAVVDFTDSHAKEILVTDQDGNGTDELYVVREGHKEKDADGVMQLIDPVRIVRFTPDGGAWTDNVVATLQDDQCRFLLSGDVDGDGVTELIAAGFKSGLWLLEPKADGTFDNVLIDADSGGFEHATHVADLDGDGKLEIYVAADEQKEFRKYTWNGTSFDRTFIDKIGPDANSHITWNIQDGVF